MKTKCRFSGKAQPGKAAGSGGQSGQNAYPILNPFFAVSLIYWCIFYSSIWKMHQRAACTRWKSLSYSREKSFSVGQSSISAFGFIHKQCKFTIVFFFLQPLLICVPFTGGSAWFLSCEHLGILNLILPPLQLKIIFFSRNPSVAWIFQCWLFMMIDTRTTVKRPLVALMKYRCLSRKKGRRILNIAFCHPNIR